MARPGCCGVGSSGYAEPCGADTRSKRPSVTPPAPPRVPFPGRRSFSPAPHRAQERESRVSGDRLGAESADSASRSGAASSQAGRDDEQGKGGRGRGESGAQTIQGAARRGGGESPRREDQAGNSPRKGPGSCPGLQALQRSACGLSTHHRPRRAQTTLPQHRPLMSFPDLPPTPPSPSRPASAGELTHRPHSGLSRPASIPEVPKQLSPASPACPLLPDPAPPRSFSSASHVSCGQSRSAGPGWDPTPGWAGMVRGRSPGRHSAPRPAFCNLPVCEQEP